MLCPFADILLISNNISSNPTRRDKIRGYTAHTQVGNGSLYGFFNNPNTHASSDFWISKKGKLEQYVDPDKHNPWSQGSGSTAFISVENEGRPEDPFTVEQIDTNGRLLAWLITNGYRIPLEVHEDKHDSGLVPHYAWFDENGHTCPGPGPRFGQYPALILAALRYLDETPPEDDDMPTAPAYAYDTNGRLWVAALGADKHTVYIKRIGIETDWVPVPGGGSSSSAPTLAPGPKGAMTVGARGDNGQSWRNTYDAQLDRWSGWLSDGGQVA